jgi:adenine-specific DNA-methyltransferase
VTEISFKGKEFVYNHHLSVPFRPLEMQADKGIGAPRLDGNLIVQGDNLHALKALLPLYAGKVDCIFIDPPYNTGNEGWAYNDNVNAPMIKTWMEDNPIGIEDGLRHDKWCAMMWPRLRLLWELLSETGVMCVSIGDDEAFRLSMLLDEVAGREARIGTFVWRRRIGSSMSSEMTSTDHEYVYVVSKRPSHAFIKGDPKDTSKYSNDDGDNRLYASMPLTVGMTKAMRPNQWYELINPDTGSGYWPPEGRVWGYYPPTMKTKVSEGRIMFPDNYPDRRMTAPRLKTYWDEATTDRKPTSTWMSSVGKTEEGTKLLKEIFGETLFSYPKPLSVVSHFIEQFSGPNSLILDSFAGSGTTAHAVLETNKRDGGNRQFILCEMEDYADELTAERVRRVINGYDFTGTQKTELLREKISWSKLRKADALVKQVEALENLHGHEYDKIKPTVKDGELIVTGETKVEKRADGLGGEFTYCTLGTPVALDAILTGDALPDYASLGAVLFHMATNRPLDPKHVEQESSYLGEIEGQKLWLIYQDDLDWLRSPDAALTLSFARKIAADHPDTKHLVFAPARYVSQKMLGEENLPVEFAPLPFALYRVERE